VVSSKCLLEKVADSIFHAPPELHESEDFTRPSFSRSGENRIGCESCGPTLALLYGYKRFQPRGSTHGIVKSKPPYKGTGRRIQSCLHSELTHADHKLKLHRDPRRWFSTRQAASFRSNFAPDDLLRISGATSPKKKTPGRLARGPEKADLRRAQPRSFRRIWAAMPSSPVPINIREVGSGTALMSRPRMADSELGVMYTIFPSRFTSSA
jgi:hypothetical protein